MGTAIVAIPKQDDYVWNISSEKIPHMTLLFLGDLAGDPALPHIEEFLQHAINMTLNRFSMTVDRRGVLGADNADVVFFDDYNTKLLKRFRENLLQDSEIRKAYDSVPQFEGWTPHLTLGYPTTPAKKDPRDYPGISWVGFDRIAIWTGDFEGPTFDLKDSDSEVMSMSGEDVVENILAHFGIRGMRWGVRRNQDHLGSGSGTGSETKSGSGAKSGGNSKSGSGSKSYTKAQIKNEAAFMSTNIIITNIPPKVNSFTIDHTGKPAVVISVSKGSKADHDHAVATLKRPLHSYEKVVNVTTMNEQQALASKAHFAALKKDAEKASQPKVPGKSSNARTAYRIGNRAVRFAIRQDDMDISEDTVDNTLAHFGVRGMRWGVRRSPSQLSGGSAASTTSKTAEHPSGGGSGGGKSGEHKSAEATQKHATERLIKRHGTDAVNNNDLQDLVNRVNLERKYKDLFPKKQTKFDKGKALTTKILLNVGEDYAMKLGKGFNDIHTKKLLDKVGGAAKTKIATSATTKAGAEMTTLIFKKGFKTGFAP